jgi:hypothetical protein
MDPRADQVVLSGHPEPAIGRAGRDQYGMGDDFLTGTKRNHVIAVGLSDPGDLHRRQQLDAVAFGLRDKAIGQLRAADPLRKARVVLDPLGDAGLPTQP